MKIQHCIYMAIDKKFDSQIDSTIIFRQIKNSIYILPYHIFHLILKIKVAMHSCQHINFETALATEVFQLIKVNFVVFIVYDDFIGVGQ